MSTVLRKWGVILAQGVIAILTSVLISLGLDNSRLVLVCFSLFIFIESILIIVSGTRWSVILTGAAGIIASMMLFIAVGVSNRNQPIREPWLMQILSLVAYWAFASGLLQVITGLYLRMSMHKEWLYGTAGLVSIAFGFVLLVATDINLVVLAAYAFVYGVLLVIFSLRLRIWLRKEKAESEAHSVEIAASEERNANVEGLSDTSITLTLKLHEEYSRWWAFLIRGLLALVLAVISLMALLKNYEGYAILTPFSLFAIISGVLAIIAIPRLTQILAGVADIVAGVFIFWFTVGMLLMGYWGADMTARVLSYISVWAVITGVLEGVTSVWFRKIIHGEWLMAASGGITAILGIVLIIIPYLGLTFLTAFAFVFAALQIALAVRLSIWMRRNPLQ